MNTYQAVHPVRTMGRRGEGPSSARPIAEALAAMGLAYVMEEYEGAHIEYLPDRVESRLLPFVARAVHGELPRVASGTIELGTILAGQRVPEASIELVGPSAATGAFPELSLDLSAIGVPDPLPMQHDGAGRYTAAPSAVPPETGPFLLTVNVEEGSGVRFPLSLLHLSVWPAHDVLIVADGLGDGWSTQAQRVTALEPRATAQTYEGSSALSVQVNGLLKLNLTAAAPVKRLGYSVLRFAFHPGDVSGTGTGEGLDVSIGVKRATLWPPKPGGLQVDMASKAWQVVELPLAEVSPYTALASLGFTGKLTGTFYLDDVRLVASAPPAPPPTAVLEEFAAALPARLSLAQNYPNPFNSETVIRFEVPQSVEVNLSLYDLLGQQVAVLASGPRAAGAYAVRWDGRDDRGRALASGVYLYRLRAGGREESRRLALVR